MIYNYTICISIPVYDSTNIHPSVLPLSVNDVMTEFLDKISTMNFAPSLPS